MLVLAGFSVGRDAAGTLAREGAGQRHDGEIGKAFLKIKRGS